MSPYLVLIMALGALPAAPSAACSSAAPGSHATLTSRQMMNANRNLHLGMSASSLVNHICVASYHDSPVLTDGLPAALALPPTVPLPSCCVPFLGRPPRR